jgi:hypothetical protein
MPALARSASAWADAWASVGSGPARELPEAGGVELEVVGGLEVAVLSADT